MRLLFIIFISSHLFAKNILKKLIKSKYHQVSELLQLDVDIMRAQSLSILPKTIKKHKVEFRDEHQQLWTLHVLENPNKKGPSFFIPHDNEDEAFQAASWGIQKYGGHLIAVECGELRTCQGIDPNRVFNFEDSKFKCRKAKKFKNQKDIFVKTVMNFFCPKKKYPVITLHNNVDGHQHTGGDGVIYADLPIPYKGAVGTYRFGDPDDMVLYAGKGMDYFDQMEGLFQDLNLNTIYENLEDSDVASGHMSNFVILKTKKAYFNIEAQVGHLKEQIKYLDALLQNI